MKFHTFRAFGLCFAFGLPSCASYQPAPLEVQGVLEQLDAVNWAGLPALSGTAELPSPGELAAFAVEHNPTLARVRASWDVHQSLLVEAGLLPDVELGWDGMDWLAGEWSGEGSTSVDGLVGFGLMFPLLRPGELDAREGAARGEIKVVMQRIRAAEWQLSLDVFLACERLAAADQLVRQTEELGELLGSTAEFFRRAKEAGTVTAIAANLALGEFQAMQLDGLRAQANVLSARQALNGLLGLAPNLGLEIAIGDPFNARDELQLGLEALIEHGLDHRPDLGLSLANYEVAEEQLRLAVSQQYPRLALGTGIQLSVPLFSGFGQAAIETAQARREEASREFTARVHGARQEIAAEHALWGLLQRELELLEQQLLPNAEETLALSRASFGVGEVTLLETLELQRALVNARTRHIETRAARAQQAWKLLAASGWLLPADPAASRQPNANHASPNHEN